MKYQLGELLYFSPTKSTKQILEAIAKGFGSTAHRHLDATYSSVSNEQGFSDDEICLLGSPVYAGRVPPLFLSRISHIRGHGRPAVIVVVYGNRDFEDALVELFDFAVAQGFRPIAAAAFIGEHAYSTAKIPLSPGRPDATDIAQAIDFGERLFVKASSTNTDLFLSGAAVPGNRPYKPIPVISNLAPTTDLASCTSCRRCVQVCPVRAISDSDKCIRCCACIKECPVGARSMTDERIVQIINRLFTTCTIRKEPRFIS